MMQTTFRDFVDTKLGKRLIRGQVEDINWAMKEALVKAAGNVELVDLLEGIGADLEHQLPQWEADTTQRFREIVRRELLTRLGEVA